MPVVLTQSVRMPSTIALTDKALMRELGQMAVRAIQARTRQGQDMHGRAFAPYAPSYAKQKAEAGVSSGAVDLTVSGDLLNTLQVLEVTDTSVTLGWAR